MIKVATLSAVLVLSGFALPEAAFEAQVIDDKITVGYGLAVADLDGDGKVDILLADSDRTVAYRGPNWEMRELTGKLTKKDHVCLCAKDLDGDNKAEIAVGAEWNPGDTKTSGAVFSLNGSADCFAKRGVTELHRASLFWLLLSWTPVIYTRMTP